MTDSGLQLAVKSAIAGIDRESVIIVPFLEDDNLADVPEVAALGGQQLADAVARREVRAQSYDVTMVHGSSPLAFVGAGSRADLDALKLARVCAAASRYVTGRGFTRLAIVDRRLVSAFEFGQAAVEGAIGGTYDPGVRKTRDRTPRRLESITLVSGQGSSVEEGARVGRITAEARSIARDLVNLPPNDLTPRSFAERAQALAAENALACDVLDEQRMTELKMGSLLGVAAGSAEPPRLIVLRYGDAAARIKLAVVGKGLTFDSGGLSLKTAEGMETMKGDMGGGAVVVAAMVAIARLAPAGLSVTGYVGATENMPGGAAMRPGDVLTAMTGETIEVLNTDAEGRLVLADVLAYAAQQGATHIVDFATLTGGAVVALGHTASAVIARPAAWGEQVVEAAAEGLERTWQMPLFEEYRRAMDSEVADIKNVGGRAASALTAAAFLADFVGDQLWAHVDIAGTAFADKDSPFRPRGGTGEGVGTIVALARRLASA
jgi:leucyl aminopeptidase